jgi:hypothetical protein
VFWTVESGGEQDIVSTGSVLSTNTTSHVAVVLQAGDAATLYLDGAEVARGSADVKPTLPPLDVGAAHASLYFAGVIDEPAVYEHAVTPERIAAHARAAGLAD